VHEMGLGKQFKGLQERQIRKYLMSSRSWHQDNYISGLLWRFSQSPLSTVPLKTTRNYDVERETQQNCLSDNFHNKLYPQISTISDRNEYSLSKRYGHYKIKLICWNITITALIMLAVSSSERMVNIYLTT
jgi:hypothetical protein